MTPTEPSASTIDDLLGDGDRLPRMVTTEPGPPTRAASAALDRYEAPGVNAVGADGLARVWLAARGSNVIDTDGNRFVDLTAGFGVTAIGHRHPRVVAALIEQSGRLIHGLGDAAAHPLRVELAKRLGRRAPVEDPVVYWAISGADAVEIAVKTALLATARSDVLVFDPSYHGTTLGALAATSRPAFRTPFAAHLHRCSMRLPFACSGRLIRTQLGKARFAAVLVEPIVGREGVLVPPDGWLAELADACQATGTLLIADEIFTGFGRTGTWFTVERDGVRPDLLCCGKALAGGLPIGAVVGRRAVMEAWRAPGEARHTATFLAHPLACAAGLACLQEIEDRRLPRRAARLGEWLGTRIGDWADRFAPVTAVRGRGLLWGIETTTAEQAKRLAAAAWRRGLLVLAGGAEGRVLQLAPPLVIAERQLSHAVDLLTAILTTDPDAGAAP